MGTNYIAPMWRMPQNVNRDKLSNYSINFTGASRVHIGLEQTTDFLPGEPTASGNTANPNFSASIFFNFSSTISGSTRNMFGVGQTGGASYWYLRKNASDNLEFFVRTDQVSPFYTTVTGSTVLNADQWYHACVTWDGNNINLYLDGQPDASPVAANNFYFGGGPGTEWPSIGSYWRGSSSINTLWTGRLAQASLFNYELSSSQVGDLNNGVNPMVFDTVPTFYYPIGDNSNTPELPYANGATTYPNISVGADSVFDSNGTGYVVTKTGDEFDISTKFTFSLWLNMQTIVNYDHIFGASNGTWTEGFGLFQTGSNGTLRFFVDQYNTNGKFVNTDTTLDSNRWYHICGTFDNTNGGLLYVNGQAQNSGTAFTSASLTSVDLNKIIRIFGTTSGYIIDALISNFQLWNTELTAPEVNTLYNNGQPLMTGTQPQEANLKAWYKLNQSANWEADTVGEWQIPDNTSAYPQSFDFSTQDNIESPHIDMTGAMSISGWFKTTDTGYNIIYQEDGAVRSPIVSGRNWFFSTVNNVLRFAQFYDSGGSNVLNTSGVTVNDGDWHHGVFVWDGTTGTDSMKIFVDGILRAKLTAAKTDRNNDDITGMIGGNSATYDMNGELSNIQIWDTNLTYGTASNLGDTAGGQVAQLYNNGVPLTTAIATDNLKVWYKLDNTEVWENVAEQWRVKNNEITNVYYNRAGQSSFGFLSAYFNYVTTTNLTQSRTISLWIKYDINRQHPTPRTGFFNNPSLAFYSTGFREVNQASTGLVSFLVPGITLNDGGWHHVLLHTRGDSTATDNIAYIDGKLANRSVTGSNSFTFGNPGVGYSNRSGNLPPAGYSFSNVVMYNGDATSNVDTLYNNGTPPEDVSSTNPDVWWKVNSTDNSVTTLEDFSGNNNDGVSTYTGPVNMVTDEWIAESGVSSGMTEQNLVNNNVSVLNGESLSMNSTNLVQSNLTKKVPFSNYSYNLDGGTEYWTAGTTLGDSLGNSYTDPISVSIWINTGSLTQEQGIFSLCKNNATLDELSISLNYDFGYYWTLNANGNDAYISTGSAPIAANTWHHLLCTFEPSAMKLYIDGQEISLSGTTTYTNLDLTGIETLIGGYYQIGVREFLGYLSNCAVWNQILTQDDALNLYNNGVPQDLNNFRLTPIRWWSLDQKYSYWNGTNIIGRDVISGDDATGINIAQIDLKGNAPGSDANGTGINLSIDNLIGNMKLSNKNAYSINMADYADSVINPANSGRSTDTP
jgi:hypothetical protein